MRGVTHVARIRERINLDNPVTVIVSAGSTPPLRIEPGAPSRRDKAFDVRVLERGFPNPSQTTNGRSGAREW